jgi:hypothetical protein
VASVKAVEVAAASLDSKGIALSQINVVGVRLRADRSREGRLQFAGIELAPPPSTPLVTKPASRPAAATTTQPVGGTAPFFVTLQAFKLRDLTASFEDHALGTPTLLALHVDELTTREIRRSTSGILTLPVEGTFRAPGIAQTITVKGSLQPFEPPFAANVTFAAKTSSLMRCGLILSRSGSVRFWRTRPSTAPSTHLLSLWPKEGCAHRSCSRTSSCRMHKSGSRFRWCT